jgi:two-component system, cell cycle sensor histidine kinase and response regulator CckA
VDDVAYRLMFEASPRPMALADRGDGVVIAVNRAWCSVFGWTEGELVGTGMAGIRDASGRPCHKNGQALDVELMASELDLGNRACTLTFVYDIRPYAALERRFRLMVENSVDGISLSDPTGLLQYVSPGGARMVGREPAEMVGIVGGTVIHPEDLAKALRPKPGETVLNTTRSMHHDGKWRWIEAYTTNLTADPSIGAYVSNFRDVTERHEASERLRRSEANFRTLIERLPTATFVHRGGAYVYVNPAAVAMLGWSRAADLIGRSQMEFIVAEDQALVLQAIAQTVTTGSSAMVEARMMRRDGSMVTVEGKAVLLDFDGEPTHVVLANDVTERRALFTRMAVADRMLSVGTLAAGVAHEINNPLAYISANLQILSGELPKLLYGDGTPRFTAEELESVLADAREGAARVSAIVRDLRALARPEENTTGSVDVLHVLAQSIKMTSNELRHRARVSQSYAEVPPVRADASRLGQVFLNLLVNAAHAIEDGHVEANEIRIRVHADAERVYVEIEDTGVGIPASVLPRIFDPFFTTKPAGVGIGLGLSICDRIVESFGGSITVTSKLGFGTTFRVALPIAAQLPLGLVAEQVLPTLARSRILMIDDEAAVGRSIRLLLAPDHEVVNVTRALDGLAQLEAGEVFDMILCDVMMPEMSGIELFAQLQARFPAYTQRTVFMTGGAFTSQAREALESLGTPRLEKPFSEGQLRKMIALALGDGAAPTR